MKSKDEAKKAAELLQKYCKDNSCNSCQFSKGAMCVIRDPSKWQIGTAGES